MIIFFILGTSVTRPPLLAVLPDSDRPKGKSAQDRLRIIFENVDNKNILSYTGVNKLSIYKLLSR